MLVYIYVNSKSNKTYFKCISCVVYLVVGFKQHTVFINKRFNKKYYLYKCIYFFLPYLCCYNQYK